MGKTFNMVGGGAGGASYAVYGYAEEKTTAGSAGDIQVYPAADMTAYYIGATEPSDAVDGLVWIAVGSGRFEFPPIDNEPLTVPISGAKAFRGGVWENAVVKYFDGAEWIPNIIRIVTNGVEDVAIYKSGVVDYYNNRVIVGGSSSQKSIYCTDEKINITNISAIHIDGYNYISGKNILLCVDTDKNFKSIFVKPVKFIVVGTIAETPQPVLNVEELTGEYYIKICAAESDGSVTFSNLWCE